MKFQKRLGVFESNSSSTHSMTMCLKEDYEKFKRGELFFDCSYDDFKTKEQVVEEMTKKCLRDCGYAYDINKSLEENFNIMKDRELVGVFCDNLDDFLNESLDIKTYAKWRDSDYLESFYGEFVSPSGDVVVSFGLYGYN